MTTRKIPFGGELVKATSDASIDEDLVGIPDTGGFTSSEDGDILCINTGHGGKVWGSFRSDGGSDFVWSFEAAQSLFVGKLRSDLTDARKAEIRTAIDAGLAKVLEHFDALPDETGHGVGDIINVAGVVYVLRSDTQDANVLRGVVGTTTSPWVGVSAEGNLVEWRTDQTGGTRGRLPKSVLGASPRSSIWVILQTDGGVYDQLDFQRDSALDTATEWGYADTSTSLDVEAGANARISFYTDSTLGTAVAIHSGDRWERYADHEQVNIPHASASTRGTISAAQFNRWNNPVEVDEPLTLTPGTADDEPIIGIDQSAFDDFIYGPPIRTQTIGANTLKQALTTPLTWPADGDYFFYIPGYGGGLVPTRILRNRITSTAAPTGVAQNDGIPTGSGRYALTLDGLTLYLMRTATNELLFGTSIAITGGTQLYVYRPGGASSGQAMGQQIAASFNNFPTYSFTVWTRSPLNTIPAPSGVGYDGVAFTGFPSGRSLSPASLPGTDPLWAEDITVQRPQPGTAGNWSQVSAVMHPAAAIEFSTVAAPTDPATQISLVYTSAAQYWRAYLDGGTDTGWIPIGRIQPWERVAYIPHWRLIARSSTIRVAVGTGSGKANLIDDEFIIHCGMSGPTANNQVWSTVLRLDALGGTVPNGTTGFSRNNTITFNAIIGPQASRNRVVAGVALEQGAPYNEGVGQRLPFSFCINPERGTDDNEHSLDFSWVRLHSPSSWATALAENAAIISLSIWRRRGTGIGGR